MPLNNQILTSKPSMYNVLEALRENINYNLNCVKVAIVESFNPDNLTVACRVANKRVIGLKDDGNQILQDYPLIYAKVNYFGWGSAGATFPIQKGMEGILLFNDRELETWFLTGDGGNLAYDRNHNLSDAIFVCGVHSVPHMIQIALNSLHWYYYNSDVQICPAEQIINTTGITANLDESMNIEAPVVSMEGNLNAESAYTGVVPCGTAVLNIQNGIIIGVS